MAQKKSLIDEALTDAEQVRETALANAKAQLEEAFTPRIQSMVSKELSEGLNEEEEPEGYGDSDDYEDDEEEPEGYGDSDDYDDEVDEAKDEDDGKALPDPTNADDAEMDDLDEEEDMEDDEYDSESDDEDVDLDLESVIAELEAEINEEGDYEDKKDGDEDEEMDESLDEDIVDLDELLQSLSEEEDMDYEDDEDDEEEMEETLDLEELFNSLEEGEETENKVETLAAENSKLTSENAEYREAVEILRSKLNEVNLLNAKLLYTSKLFKKYSLNNSQKMKVVESFDRTKSVRETKLVYSTLAESFQIGGSSSGKSKRTKSITEGLASKPVKSTKPSKDSEIIKESNDLANRFKKLVNHNK